MNIKAKLNYLKISPRKTRLVGNLIKGMNFKEAEKTLSFTYKRAAGPFLKLLKSAGANAKNNFPANRQELAEPSEHVPVMILRAKDRERQTDFRIQTFLAFPHPIPFFQHRKNRLFGRGLTDRARDTDDNRVISPDNTTRGGGEKKLNYILHKRCWRRYAAEKSIAEALSR